MADKPHNNTMASNFDAENDNVNPLSLSVLSLNDISEAVMKMIPSCCHHELVLVAAYLLRGDQHLDERKKLARLITSDPIQANQNKSTPARRNLTETIGNQEITKQCENQEQVVQKLLTSNNNNPEQHLDENKTKSTASKQIAVENNRPQVENHVSGEKPDIQSELEANRVNQSCDVESTTTPTEETEPTAKTNDQRWESNFQQLLKYREEHGHFKIPRSHVLGTWAKNLWQLWRQNSIPGHRLMQLQEIGFFDAQSDEAASTLSEHWEKGFQKLLAFKSSHQHCDVPPDFDKYLADWVESQRRKYRSLLLSEDRIRRLESIGFKWSLDVMGEADIGGDERKPAISLNDRIWELHYAELVKFKAAHGHVDTSNSNNPQLISWTKIQRAKHHAQCLRKDQVDRLERLGFQWSVCAARKTDDTHQVPSIRKIKKKDIWEIRFKELVEFKARHGHTNVSRTFHNQTLASFCARQRQRFRLGKLSEEKIDRLKCIGLHLEYIKVPGKPTQVKENQLVAANEKVVGSSGARGKKQRESEGTVVHKDSATNHTHQLGKWGSTPTTKVKPSPLSRDRRWEVNFQQLLKYREEHGNFRVPEKYKPLGRWVTKMRQRWRENSLPEHRLLRLQEIGFFDSQEGGNVLVASPDRTRKRRKNTSMVELRDENNPATETTANINRNKRLHARKMFDDEQNFLCVRRIDNEKLWDVRFEELVEFMSHHGHTKISQKYNPTLSAWVARQRRRFRFGTLPEEKINRMKSIGFRLGYIRMDRCKRKNYKKRIKTSKLLPGKSTQTTENQSTIANEEVIDNRGARQKKKREIGGSVVQNIFATNKTHQYGEAFSTPTTKVNSFPATQDRHWEINFQQLLKYRAEHGNFNVPLSRKSLRLWCTDMWRQWIENRLPGHHLFRLQDIGFFDSQAGDEVGITAPKQWEKGENSNACNSSWDFMYEQLIDYLDAPESYKDEIGLSQWVTEVRKKYFQGKLREDQIRGLNEIGFSWAPDTVVSATNNTVPQQNE